MKWLKSMVSEMETALPSSSGQVSQNLCVAPLLAPAETRELHFNKEYSKLKYLRDDVKREFFEKVLGASEESNAIIVKIYFQTAPH